MLTYLNEEINFKKNIFLNYIYISKKIIDDFLE